MDNQKQHYVPKVYLKQFSKNKSGHFYAAGPKSNNLRSINPRHVEQVCYLDNFYTLKNETSESVNVKDRNFLEKNAFHYESRLLPRIINKLKHKNIYLNKSYHDSFIDIYLNIKQRNPCYRNSFNSDHLSESVTKQINILKLSKEWVEEMSGENFEVFTQRIKQKIVQDKDIKDELHKRILFDSFSGNDETMNKIKTVLGKMNLFVAEPLKDSEFFLTSDNPGFTILGDRILNTHFSEFTGVGFPITSKQFVLLLGTSSQSQLEIRKKINFRKFKTEAIDSLNRATIINSNEFVFCESKKYLSDTIEKYLFK